MYELTMDPVSIDKVGSDFVIVPDNARVQVHVPLQALVKDNISPAIGLPGAEPKRSDEPLRQPRRRHDSKKGKGKAHRRSSLPSDLGYVANDGEDGNDAGGGPSRRDRQKARRRKSTAADGYYSSDDDEESDLVSELPMNRSLMRHLGNLLQTHDAVLQIVADNHRMHSNSLTQSKLDLRLRSCRSAPTLDQRTRKAESRWVAGSNTDGGNNSDNSGQNSPWDSTGRTANPSLNVGSRDFILNKNGNKKEYGLGGNQSAKARLQNMGLPAPPAITRSSERVYTQKNASWDQPGSTPGNQTMSIGNQNDHQGACRWSIPSRKSDSNLIYPKRQTSAGFK